MPSLTDALVERDYWSPKMKQNATQLRGQIVICRVPRPYYYGSETILSSGPAATVNPPPQPSLSSVFNAAATTEAGALPPIDRPRIFIWYQKDCISCQNSRPVFEALPRAAMGYTVQQVEATTDMVKRFPHVLVVPLYDIVQPETGSNSPYGPNTRLRTIRNDLRALREEFPTLLPLLTPAPAPTPTPAPTPAVTQ